MVQKFQIPIVFRYGNVGDTKAHGQIEATPRVDSFKLRDNGGDRCQIVAGRHSGKSVWVRLSRKPNGFGGWQLFFLCPACGQRVRYLYYTGGGFLCRKCARLNYRCQQETRCGPLYYYRKGMTYAEKRLRPLFLPFDPGDFSQWTPPPPRYMHEPTYLRYLARLRRYQQRHVARQEKQEAQQIMQLRRQIIAVGGGGLWQQIERCLEQNDGGPAAAP